MFTDGSVSAVEGESSLDGASISVSRPRRLLTIGLESPKVGKGQEEFHVLTAVLHLSPYDLAGAGNVCASASPECVALCLNTAGRGGMPGPYFGDMIHGARKARTRWYFEDRAGFLDKLRGEIRMLERRAKRKGWKLAIRVNGTSDLPGLALALAEEFPHVQFYDYTKHPQPWKRVRHNYHLTFSRSERNAREVLEALKNGVNVAVVFSTRKSQPLPETFLGRPVVDGDVTDLRFLDPKGADGKGLIIGLRAKGKARKGTWGFVVNV